MYKTDKLTPQMIKFLEVLPKKLANISATCRAVHISRQTYYNWSKSNVIFAERVWEVREGVYDDVETLLYTIAIGGNTTALIFYSKCQMRNRGYY